MENCMEILVTCRATSSIRQIIIFLSIHYLQLIMRFIKFFFVFKNLMNHFSGILKHTVCLQFLVMPWGCKSYIFPCQYSKQKYQWTRATRCYSLNSIEFVENSITETFRPIPDLHVDGEEKKKSFKKSKKKNKIKKDKFLLEKLLAGNRAKIERVHCYKSEWRKRVKIQSDKSKFKLTGVKKKKNYSQFYLFRFLIWKILQLRILIWVENNEKNYYRGNWILGN